MAAWGGGSNTTHALLSPDPEALPTGEVSRPATGEFLGTKELQGQPTVAPYAPLTAGPNSSLSQRYGPQGWYHTVRVPFGIDTIQYSGVLYGIAQEAPLNVPIPWCYDIFKLIPTTKPLSQKHQKISTNICHHRRDAAFVLNLFSKCEWASIGGTLLWF